MKILVFSDSHRALAGMVDAVALHRPDQIIHLGDLMEDAESLCCVYPTIPVCMVPGNCDGWTTTPLKKQITLDGRQFLLSHGHLWQVKRSYDAAIADARSCGADVLLFGHTHVPVCKQLEDGLWLMNPGSSRSSYGMIQSHAGELLCSIHHLE